MYKWIIAALCILGTGDIFAVEVKNIDFESPNIAGQPPVTGDASNLISKIIFNPPAVEAGIPDMDGQSLVFRASPSSTGYRQIQVDVNDPAVDTYSISFDVNPLQLVGTGFQFTLLMDCPQVHNITLDNDGYIKGFALDGLPKIPYQNGGKLHFDIEFHTRTKSATITVNDQIFQNVSVNTGFLQDIRFNLAAIYNGAVSDAVVALDNVKISLTRRPGERADNKGLRTDINMANVAVGTDIQSLIDNSYSTLDAVGQNDPSVEPPFGDADHNLLVFQQQNTLVYQYTDAYVAIDPAASGYNDIRFTAITDQFVGKNTRFVLSAGVFGGILSFTPDGKIGFLNKQVATFTDGVKHRFRIILDQAGSLLSLYIDDTLVDSRTVAFHGIRRLVAYTLPDGPYTVPITPEARIGIENFRIVDRNFTETALALNLLKGVNAGKCKSNVSQFIVSAENQTDQDAGNAVLNVTLPDGFSLVQNSSNATCTQDQSQINCSLGTLAGNSQTDVSLDVTGATCTQKYTVTATLDSDSYEADTSDNQAQGVFGGATGFMTLLGLFLLATQRRKIRR